MALGDDAAHAEAALDAVVAREVAHEEVAGVGRERLREVARDEDVVARERGREHARALAVPGRARGGELAPERAERGRVRRRVDREVEVLGLGGEPVGVGAPRERRPLLEAHRLVGRGRALPRRVVVAQPRDRPVEQEVVVRRALDAHGRGRRAAVVAQSRERVGEVAVVGPLARDGVDVRYGVHLERYLNKTKVDRSELLRI